uniref:Uncharacterized protein n=1 Tax=Pseudo-nitzschia australis TaxID=44445 RepID=A0A7S4APW3_9STRA|eukprot:CAMPEP_0168240356 /NCGR_PEP_ID=MMETSP0140_2-20121125/22132_1 /TAXON_ID=44445 /ORGANISM="Pseudo-nitzschia australis, Strain 10249 10 AB" /LENGTH=117 /DNA_ID=CAMNT_0008174963 /DNA_START=163 /DNA_END=516 /DNA_ORIENTATION=+
MSRSPPLTTKPHVLDEFKHLDLIDLVLHDEEDIIETTNHYPTMRKKRGAYKCTEVSKYLKDPSIQFQQLSKGDDRGVQTSFIHFVLRDGLECLILFLFASLCIETCFQIDTRISSNQ